MKRYLILLTVLVIAVMSSNVKGLISNDVFILGTIHSDSNPYYTYSDIANITAKFQPDIICVEIRPEDFRKQNLDYYPPEMILATIFGISENLKVYPIDWWTKDFFHLREEAVEMLKKPEYQKKLAEMNSIKNKNPIITDFEQKYGITIVPPDDLITLRNQVKIDYLLINNQEFNKYVMEWFNSSLSVFGDSRFNVFYKTRNEEMLRLITNVIRDNPGKRIAIITGAFHKSYFDNKLKSNPQLAVHITDLTELMPITNTQLPSDVLNFINNRSIKEYYLPGYPREIWEIENYYCRYLFPLFHGPGMDFDLRTIPAVNIAKAEKLLISFQKASPDSEYYYFEKATYELLTKKFKDSINDNEKIAGVLNENKVQSPLIKGHFLFAAMSVFRNMGIAYEILGNSEAAQKCYAQAKSYIKISSLSESDFLGNISKTVDFLKQ